MNAIIGFTGLAATHLAEPEHVKEYLKTIAQSSEHLLALINDVLDMSRIESGKMTLHEHVESLAAIREKGPSYYDIVVMDVQMPVMDGYQATAAIRALPGGDKLKIIAFSANAFEEDKEKSLRAGMDGHITKPLKIKELLQTLQRFTA